MNTLSRAGRVELLRSAVTPQVFLLGSSLEVPCNIIRQMEQSFRNFLWKGNLDKSVVIHVKWRTVCQPKSSGGLGLLPLIEWNDAVISKLINNLFKETVNLGCLHLGQQN